MIIVIGLCLVKEKKIMFCLFYSSPDCVVQLIKLDLFFSNQLILFHCMHIQRQYKNKEKKYVLS